MAVWAVTSPVALAISLGTTQLALRWAPISTWLVMRNAEPAVVAMMETAVPSMRQGGCSMATASVLLGLVMGACLIKHDDVVRGTLTRGADLVALSVLACAAARVWQRWMVARLHGVSAASLSAVSNMGGAILLGSFLLLTEPARIQALWSPECHIAMLLASCVPTTALALCGVWLQQLVPASTTAVLSCLSKCLVLVAAVGLYDETLDALQWLGVFLSLFCCVTYTWMAASAAVPPSARQLPPTLRQTDTDRAPLLYAPLPVVGRT
jgi:drug/metabolite transporter (DMT)-like permease